MAAPRNALYVRDGRLASGLWRVTAFRHDEGTDGEIRDGGAPDRPWSWSVEGAPHPALARVRIGAPLLEQVPPLWFVLVDEPTAKPRAVNLVGFADERVEPGTVLSRYAFASLGVHNDAQVGAVRWYPENGKVHQIFVAKEWRRRRVASTLLYTADAVHQAHGWSGVLHGDGRRTVLGQLLVDTFLHPNRIAVLDRVEPPMDPEPADAG
jgi:GNAT superfamily N-acetyltransferase